MVAVQFDVNAAQYFASPHLFSDPAYADFIVGEHARGVLEVAREICGDGPKEVQGDLAERMQSAVERPLPWRIAVSPELVTLKSVLATSPNPARILECVTTVLQTWARFDAMDGPGNADISPLGDGHEPAVRIGESMVTVYGADHEHPWQRPGGRPPVEAELVDAVATIEAAVEIIGRVSPAFLPWVGKAIRAIVALQAIDGNLWSSGDSVCPGVVFMSFPASRFDIANLLVHEAAHQFYIALGGVTDLHDGSDPKLYFSPAINRDRPIEMILYAFHAFANVALFESDLLSVEHHTTIGGKNRDALDLGRLKLLYAHLTETESLTDSGHVLCDPLAARLLGA